MEIKADTDVCIGAGMCALTAPAVFDQSEEDGTVVVLVSPVPEEQEGVAKRAVHACPSGAISIAARV
ncbi:ferredoxin [Nonomuraea typhae]|uniref:ferredoxin n=1 Tax=Nonomuraea typhae TaxID=2603600 RepID=UPI0012FC8ADF|nr:ferredoxin [Nonomuraea typhae]